MNTTDIYDFLKEKYSKEDFRKKLISNFSFSVSGCRVYRKANLLHFQQHPDEILGLMDFMKDKGINSYMEMGLGSCNTLFLLDSFFRVLSKDYRQSIGMDINDKEQLFKDYQTKFPSCTFILTNVLSYNFDNDFDYIFIDTNQRYSNMKMTFEKCLPHARYIGFHDIANGRWGAKALFNELSQKYDNWSWIKRSNAGIGVVKVK